MLKIYNRYPVVVKPRKGYGSVNTTVLKSEEELKVLLSKTLLQTLDQPLDMLVESFVYGQMYHIDGLFYNNEVLYLILKLLDSLSLGKIDMAISVCQYCSSI